MNALGIMFSLLVLGALVAWVLSQQKPKRQRTLEEERAYQEEMGRLEAQRDWKQSNNSHRQGYHNPFRISKNPFRKFGW